MRRYRFRQAATGLAVAAAAAMTLATTPAAGAQPMPSTSRHPSTSSGAMPVGNLPGWRQTGAQNFTHSAALGQVAKVYGQDMAGYNGFHDTSGHGRYTPGDVLSVSGGSLNWKLHTVRGVHEVATPIPFGYRGQLYGRYSVRFRTTIAKGYKMAFLLWPTSNVWNDGEIDWPEGDFNTGYVRPASAIPGTYRPSTGTMTFDYAVMKQAPASTADGRWHVATTAWTPTAVRFYFDGKLLSKTTKAVPHKPMRLTLQVETAIGAPAPAGSVVGHVQVDWVTQYAYRP